MGYPLFVLAVRAGALGEGPALPCMTIDAVIPQSEQEPLQEPLLYHAW